MNSINISIDLSLISSSFIPNKSDNDVFDCQIWMNFIQYKCDTRRKRGTINGSLKSMYDVIRHDLRQKNIDRLLRLVGFPSSVSFKFTRFLPGFPRVLREGGSGTGVGYGRSLEQGKGGRRDGDEGGGGGPRLPDWTNYIQWTSPEQQRQQQQAALGRRKKKRAKLRKKKTSRKKKQEQEEQEEAENLFLWRWAGRRGASTVSVSVGGTFGLSTLTPQSMATDGPAPIASSPFRFTSFYWVLMDVSRFYRILPGITGFGMDFAKFFLKIILSFFKQSLQASCGIRIGFF